MANFRKTVLWIWTGIDRKNLIYLDAWKMHKIHMQWIAQQWNRLEKKTEWTELMVAFAGIFSAFKTWFSFFFIAFQIDMAIFEINKNSGFTERDKPNKLQCFWMENALNKLKHETEWLWRFQCDEYSYELLTARREMRTIEFLIALNLIYATFHLR